MIPFATDSETGAPVEFPDLGREECHALITGGTATGKTRLLMLLVTYLILKRIFVFVL